MNIIMSAFARLLALTFVLALVGAGCSCWRTATPPADHSADRLAIERRLQEVIAAAEGKEFERLDSYHAYGSKFTKYSGSSAGRLDASAARKGEHDGLGAAKGLKMRAQDLKIDVFGNAGIATFILDYSFDSGTGTVHRKDRSTLVFIKEQGDWRIVHEHLTSIQP